MCPINQDLQIVAQFSAEPSNFQRLGGDGVVILVDCVRIIRHNVEEKCLIGIVELKDIPMQTHFDYAKYANNNISSNDVITIIKAAIAPGSWLIFEDVFFVQEYRKLLQDIFPVVISRSQLERHNTDEQNVLDNLSQIAAKENNAIFRSLGIVTGLDSLRCLWFSRNKACCRSKI